VVLVLIQVQVAQRCEEKQSKMLAHVYVITCSTSDRCYIGKTTKPHKRLSEHFAIAARGDQRPLYASIRKHGLETFSFFIIETYESCKDALIAESELITYFRSLGMSLYNLNDGGMGGVNPTTEVRLRISASKKGKPTYRSRESDSLRARKVWANFTSEKRKTISEKSSAAQRGKLRGKIHSDETKAKLSEMNSGERNHFFGKHHTDEVKKLLREKASGNKNPNFGKSRSEETKRKIAESVAKSWFKRQNNECDLTSDIDEQFPNTRSTTKGGI
jgi:group I intron endonuclease